MPSHESHLQESSLKNAVWQVVASIPQGKVATYGQVARMAGFPNHARQVGATLKNLPNETKLPWHRVINSQGRISFPENTPQYIKQKQLLELEGIRFSKAKINLKQYQFNG